MGVMSPTDLQYSHPVVLHSSCFFAGLVDVDVDKGLAPLTLSCPPPPVPSPRCPAVTTRRSRTRWSWSALRSWASADALFTPEAGETVQGRQTEEHTPPLPATSSPTPPPLKNCSSLTPLHLPPRLSSAAAAFTPLAHTPLLTAPWPLTLTTFHRPAHGAGSGYSPGT